MDLYFSIIFIVLLLFSTFVQRYHKIINILYLTCLPFIYIYIISLIFEIDTFEFINLIIIDMIDNNLKHIAWIIVYFVIYIYSERTI